MAVHPTRLMTKATPLDMMTVDQLLKVHGPTPVHKVIPPRPIGPPKSRDQLQAEQDQRRLYPPNTTDATSRPDLVVHSNSTSISERPKARLKPLEVAPTDPGYDGPWTAQPCRDVVELEIEVDGVGIVVYPLECEIKGGHPNQPHMAEVYGASPDPRRPRQQVFVGWADVSA